MRKCFELLHSQKKSVYRLIEVKDGVRHRLDVEMCYYDEEQQRDITCCTKDVSLNREALQNLVDRMNHEDLMPIHFEDVIEDFCQNENRLL